MLYSKAMISSLLPTTGINATSIPRPQGTQAKPRAV
jgi:hypothetical protein